VCPGTRRWVEFELPRWGIPSHTANYRWFLWLSKTRDATCATPREMCEFSRQSSARFSSSGFWRGSAGVLGGIISVKGEKRERKRNSSIHSERHSLQAAYSALFKRPIFKFSRLSNRSCSTRGLCLAGPGWMESLALSVRNTGIRPAWIRSYTWTPCMWGAQM